MITKKSQGPDISLYQPALLGAIQMSQLLDKRDSDQPFCGRLLDLFPGLLEELGHLCVLVSVTLDHEVELPKLLTVVGEGPLLLRWSKSLHCRVDSLHPVLALGGLL